MNYDAMLVRKTDLIIFANQFLPKMTKQQDSYLNSVDLPAGECYCSIAFFLYFVRHFVLKKV